MFYIVSVKTYNVMILFECKIFYRIKALQIKLFLTYESCRISFIVNKYFVAIKFW